MYCLAGGQLGAEKMRAVMYEYEPNWTTEGIHYHKVRKNFLTGTKSEEQV